MNTTQPTATLRAAAATTEGGVTLRQYDVIVDGQVIGRVGQHRAETVTRYGGGSPVGRRTARTAWMWEADNMGNYEIPTRTEAVADLLDMIG